MTETKQIPESSLELALQRHFGYRSFRPGQLPAVSATLAGRDVLAILPTGGGKSLVFQLPAMLDDGLTIVVSPLIALMKDQVDRLAARIPGSATFLNSSISSREASRRLQAITNGVYRMLYVAPERFRVASFQEAMAEIPVRRIVVDEAHCVSEWGHDFRPDYLNIPRFADSIGRPPILALTATATEATRRDIVKQLGLIGPEIVIAPLDRPNLRFAVQTVRQHNAKLEAIVEASRAWSGSGIVYTSTRQDTEMVASHLIRKGERAAYYHAGMDARSRADVQEAFLDDRVRIVVATNAFGLGIDKPDVRFVIHFTAPATPEALFQESGRAGRDSGPADCLLLFSPGDALLQERLISRDLPDRFLMTKLLSLLQPRSGDRTSADPDQLANRLNISDTALRLALAGLERSEALVRVPDEGGKLVFEQVRQRPDPRLFAQVGVSADRRVGHRRRLIRLTSAYANSTECRRAWWLRYFGEEAGPRALDPGCCDRCAERAAGQTPQDLPAPAWAAHRALVGAAELGGRFGRRALGNMLKGGPPKEVERFHLERFRSFGTLSELRKADVDGLVDELVVRGYLQLVGEEYPKAALTDRGRAVAEAEAPEHDESPESSHILKRANAGTTVDTRAETLSRFKAGSTPEEIAKERGLTENTVYAHLASLIGAGTLMLSELVDDETAAIVRAAVAIVQSRPPSEEVGFLRSIRDQCRRPVPYNAIRCVLAADNVVQHQAAIKIEETPARREPRAGEIAEPPSDDGYSADFEYDDINPFWEDPSPEDTASAGIRERSRVASALPVDRESALSGLGSLHARDRARAAHLLGRVGSRVDRRVLLEISQSDPDHSVRAAAKVALTRLDR